MKKIILKKGFTLVEVLVSISIFTVVLGSLIVASNMYLSGAGDALKNTEGAYCAQEEIEAVKIMRDTNWNSISTSTTAQKYLVWGTASSTWMATTTATTTCSTFTRTFSIATTSRDSNGRLTTSGGTRDDNTLKVTVTVSWKTKTSTTTKTLSTYITNII
jgi:prepilin-type N-terminal cleavage/methylation domain-containing protein